MWYENPGWWPIGISIVSLGISFWALMNSRRATRATIEQRLAQHMTDINEAILRHEVKGPYAYHLQVPDERVKDFTRKAVIFLHHINLLRNVFENKDILRNDTVLAYRHWANVIVRPWVEADDDLRQTFRVTKDSKDLYGKAFIEWLQELFPILN